MFIRWKMCVFDKKCRKVRFCSRAENHRTPLRSALNAYFKFLKNLFQKFAKTASYI